MRVAIMSDIHDNIPQLKLAMQHLDAVDELLCLGDLCSPFIVKELALGFSGPIHIVFGNNDGDRYRITDCAQRYPNVMIHGEYVDLEIGGKTFSLNHFDNIGRAGAEGKNFDVVCFGHSHRFGVENHGETIVINPGEIYGILTGHSTFAIYDTEQGKVERVEVSG